MLWLVQEPICGVRMAAVLLDRFRASGNPSFEQASPVIGDSRRVMRDNVNE